MSSDPPVLEMACQIHKGALENLVCICF